LSQGAEGGGAAGAREKKREKFAFSTFGGIKIEETLKIARRSLTYKQTRKGEKARASARIS